MNHTLTFKHHPVKKLHSLLHAGQFAVPKLQRVFVWNGQKAAKLLDSVYRMMPIGALTVWNTTRANRHLLRVSTSVLPPYKEVNDRVWFLLDGQQRLSVLHRIFEGGVVTNGSQALVDFARVVFRVSDGEDGSRFQYRKPDNREWVSVTDVLATTWRNRLKGLSKGQLKRVEDCRRRVIDYKVPIVFADMKEIDEARELFIRINSSGTPLAAADRAFARAAKFDLREMASGTFGQLPAGFHGLTNEVLLQTRALLDGVLDVGVEAMSKVVDQWNVRIGNDANEVKSFTRKWVIQQAAMGRALDLLRKEFQVLDDSLLPYQNMVSTLTTFFVESPRQPSNNQLAELRKWFWGTALGQRYSGGGYRQNILSDVEFFRGLAHGASAKFKLAELLDPADIRRASYGKRSSISDAFFCLLIRQGPIYLSNGTPMQVTDFAGAANRKHKHHIFPRRFLLDRGVGKTSLNTVLNLCFISAEENSQFGARAPSKYLDAHRGARHFEKAMDRHLIPVGDESGLWKLDRNGYLDFLKQRERVVCAAFESAAGTKLFRREST